MPKGSFKDCVDSVKMQNNTKPKRKKVNPFAVCTSALKKGPQNGKVISEGKKIK